MLIQLPCGSWVEAGDIVSIRICPGKNILVETAKATYISEPVDIPEKVRDALADQVNKAKLANLMPTTDAPPSKS